ncbi:hypothetical protein Tco_1221564 [Tanacetum coccineum]
MLPKFSQIVNRLYAFIYETNHSKSGLGLPSIVALVMVIDKSWTLLERHEKAFYTGLTKFVDDCKPLVNSAGNIKCPCKSCRTVLWVSIKHLPDHISKYGFDPSYKTWIHHGEPDLPPPPPVIDNTRRPQMSDMTACLNDLSYIPLNNEQNEPTQGDECRDPPVDGRHPWKNIDTAELRPNFAKEPRNVRLELAYSMWPVILTTYNLPMWLCMEESSFMLTLLIPGPKSLGKDIDVYLRPLIDDLKPINDFPARSSLSGWSGQGYKACPTCNKDTPSVRVLGKTAYIRQRHVDNDPGVSATNELFALACGPTTTPIFSNLAINGVRNNMTQILTKGEAFKDDQYILATQFKQCFYLEDMARRQPHWKVVEHVNHKKFSNGGAIVVEEDHDVIYFDKSSDLPLSTNDDIIDDEDAFPHDLADSDNEDLVNVDDDDGVDVNFRQRLPTTKFGWKERRKQAAYLPGDAGNLGRAKKSLMTKAPVPESQAPTPRRVCPIPKKRSWPSFERASSEGTFPMLVGYYRDWRASAQMDVTSPCPPQCHYDPADVEKLKKSNKSLTKQVKMMMRLFRSDDKFSQMLNPYESNTRVDNGQQEWPGCG